LLSAKLSCVFLSFFDFTNHQKSVNPLNLAVSLGVPGSTDDALKR